MLQEPARDQEKSAAPTVRVVPLLDFTDPALPLTVTVDGRATVLPPVTGG